MKTSVLSVILCVALATLPIWAIPFSISAEDVEEPPQEIQEASSIPVVVVEEESEMVLYDVPLSEDLQIYIVNLCEEHHIDPTIILAMIERETQFNADLIGDNGNSYGLLQIQPRWHSARMDKLGVTDLLDPYQNVAVAVDYLAELVVKYDGNIEMALVAYNAGPTGAYNGWFSKGIYSSHYSETVVKTAAELKGEE